MILLNEVLHQAGRSTFYKTYDTVKDLYGVHINIAGTYLEPVFLHVFKFEKGEFVVVDQLEQYYGIDLKGTRIELSEEEEGEWSSTIIKNSVCNCIKTRTQDTCRYCDGKGSLINSFGFKLLSAIF